MEAGRPVDGVFPDSMRVLQKIPALKVVAGENDILDKIRFKVHLGSQKPARWVNEEVPLEKVVKLYDLWQQDKDTPGGKADNISHTCEQWLVTRVYASKRQMLWLTWSHDVHVWWGLGADQRLERRCVAMTSCPRANNDELYRFVAKEEWVLGRKRRPNERRERVCNTGRLDRKNREVLACFSIEGIEKRQRASELETVWWQS